MYGSCKRDTHALPGGMVSGVGHKLEMQTEAIITDTELKFVFLEMTAKTMGYKRHAQGKAKNKNAREMSGYIQEKKEKDLNKIKDNSFSYLEGTERRGASQNTD